MKLIDTTPGRRSRTHYAYAQLTDVEYAWLSRIAQREGLSMSNFVRRCVNNYLLDEDDNAPLLLELVKGRPRTMQRVA
jgi:hypothetical protein